MPARGHVGSGGRADRGEGVDDQRDRRRTPRRLAHRQDRRAQHVDPPPRPRLVERGVPVPVSPQRRFRDRVGQGIDSARSQSFASRHPAETPCTAALSARPYHASERTTSSGQGHTSMKLRRLVAIRHRRSVRPRRPGRFPPAPQTRRSAPSGRDTSAVRHAAPSPGSRHRPAGRERPGPARRQTRATSAARPSQTSTRPPRSRSTGLPDVESDR